MIRKCIPVYDLKIHVKPLVSEGSSMLFESITMKLML